MSDREMHDARDGSASAGPSLTEPASAPEHQNRAANIKTDTDTVGEASGGFLGAVGGMALGAVGGPVGLVLGGLAGAVGGWWAGREVSDAITDEDRSAHRADYARSPHHLADRAFDSVGPAYAVGHLAARNPDYRGRTFDQVDSDLERAWSGEPTTRLGSWQSNRPFARAAFDRIRATDTAEDSTVR